MEDLHLGSTGREVEWRFELTMMFLCGLCTFVWMTIVLVGALISLEQNLIVDSPVNTFD